MKCLYEVWDTLTKQVNCNLSSKSSGCRVFASTLLEDWSWMLWVEWNQQILLQEHTQYWVKRQTCRYVYVITDTGFQIQQMKGLCKQFAQRLILDAGVELNQQILLQVHKWHWVEWQTCRYIYDITVLTILCLHVKNDVLRNDSGSRTRKWGAAAHILMTTRTKWSRVLM